MVAIFHCRVKKTFTFCRECLRLSSLNLHVEANRFFLAHSVAHSLIGQFCAKRGGSQCFAQEKGAHAAPLITARKHVYLLLTRGMYCSCSLVLLLKVFSALAPRG